MKDVLQVIEQAKELYENKTEQTKKARKWVDNFARTVTYYGGVLDVIVQYDPAHAGLAWGALKFVFTVWKYSWRSAECCTETNQLDDQGVLNHSARGRII